MERKTASASDLINRFVVVMRMVAMKKYVVGFEGYSSLKVD